MNPHKLSPGRLWLALAAIQTGVLAGLVAMAYLMLDGILRGQGPWVFANLLSGLFSPNRALSLAFSTATMSGLALHVVASGLAGLFFAAVLFRYRFRHIRAYWLGAILGVVWYYLSFRFFWTYANPLLVAYQPFPGAILGHVVFGFCMGLYPKFVGDLEGVESEQHQAGMPSLSEEEPVEGLVSQDGLEL